MGTRATYTIHSKSNEMTQTSLTFYCHWDGYPEGAAHKFLDMLNAYHIESNRGGYIENFIRANEQAEITQQHLHGDTEFHYTLYADNQLAAYSKDWDSQELTFIDKLPLHEFINNELEETLCIVDANNNINTLKNIISNISEKTLYAMKATSDGWTGNASSSTNEIRRLLLTIKDINENLDNYITEINNFIISDLDPIHAESYGNGWTLESWLKRWDIINNPESITTY